MEIFLIYYVKIFLSEEIENSKEMQAIVTELNAVLLSIAMTTMRRLE